MSTKPFRIFKKCTALLAALACLSGSGVHWIVPKIAIWSLMIVDYSRTTSIAQAIESTLSGKKPCHRCHSLKLAEAAEKNQSPITLESLKSDFFLPISTHSLVGFYSGSETKQSPLNDASLYSLFEFQPPTPPPRSA